MFEVVEILRFYNRYKARRLQEQLSQGELLKQELKLISAALLVILLLGMTFWALVLHLTRS